METFGEIKDKERGDTSLYCGEKKPNNPTQPPNLIPLNAQGQSDSQCAGDQDETH